MTQQVAGDIRCEGGTNGVSERRLMCAGDGGGGGGGPKLSIGERDRTRLYILVFRKIIFDEYLRASSKK